MVSKAFPGHGNVSAADRKLVELRREPERTRQERDILKKPWPFSPDRREALPIHREATGNVSNSSVVCGAGRLAEWVLRVASPSAQRAGASQCAVVAADPAGAYRQSGVLMAVCACNTPCGAWDIAVGGIEWPA